MQTRKFLFFVLKPAAVVFLLLLWEGSPESFSAIEAGLKPTRILSLNLCSDELLLRLVEPNRIVGVTWYSHNPENSTMWREARTHRAVRGEAEETLYLKADLILAGPFSRRETLHFLRKKHKPLVVIDVPQDFEAIRNNIRSVAAAVGEETQGEVLIREMDTRLQAVPQPAGRKPRVLFYHAGGYAPGVGTFEDAIIRHAGGINLAAEAGIHGHGAYPLERLVVERPDFILFSGDPAAEPSMESEILRHPVLRRHLVSVGKIVLPPAYVTCGGPASVEAVEMIARHFAEAKT